MEFQVLFTIFKKFIHFEGGTFLLGLFNRVEFTSVFRFLKAFISATMIIQLFCLNAIMVIGYRAKEG